MMKNIKVFWKWPRFSFLYFFVFLVFGGPANGQPHIIDGPALISHVVYDLIQRNSLDESFNSSSEYGRRVCEISEGGSVCAYIVSVGQGICYAGRGGSVCAHVNSIGQGICYAGGGGSVCAYVNSIGQGICYAGGGGSTCAYVNSIGQGICYAGGVGSTCPYVNSVGQGICYAGGGGSICPYVNSIGQGIERANNSDVDLKFAWDLIRDEFGNSVWVCRGKNTRRFQDLTMCSGLDQTDKNWPGLGDR